MKIIILIKTPLLMIININCLVRKFLIAGDSVFRVAVFIGVLYSIILNLLVFAFISVTEGLFQKTTYVHIGIIGTIFVITSLGYIFRKYHFKKLSKMKTWLDLHIVTGTIGALLIIIHSEFYFRAVIPSIALVAMELVAISGVIGRYLIQKLSQTISQEKKKIAQEKKENPEKEENMSINEEELMLLISTAKVMRQWKFVHMQFTTILTISTVLHVLFEFYFRGLRL